MDEQRIQAYLQLIYSLLYCPDGQESELLEANSDLVDGELLEWMALVAADLAENGNQNATDWLLNFASQLAEALGISSSSATREEYFAFLGELLEAVWEIDENPQAVYQVLQQYLNKLDTHFAQILQEVGTAWISEQPEDAELIVALIENISSCILEFPLGNIANNQEIAIAGYAVVLQNREEDTEMWAQGQNNLGNAYQDRIKGDKADNIEFAIAAFTKALQVYTPQAFPQDWATTQNNLGSAYSNRIKGDKADNIEFAIAAYTNALQVYTPQAFPQHWAMTQNNLGGAYKDRIKGDKADNIELAIAAYTKALQVRTPQALPHDWAMTQNNLGTAYCWRIKGDKADNIELSIAAYTLALQVLTFDYFPIECLTVSRSLGDLAFEIKNWQLAIESYEKALASVERSRNWATTDKRRHEILKDAIKVYEKMVQACINNGQLDKAIEYSERSRSKTMGDIMASNRYFDRGEIDLELKQAWQKYDDLQQQINLLTLAYQNAETQLAGTKRIATPESLQADEEAIEQLEAEKQQTWEELRRRDPVLAGQLQVDPLNLSQIQRLIDNDKTALLSFYTTQNDTHIFILLKERSPQLFTCEGQGVKALQSWLWDNWLIPYVEFRNTGNWEWKDKMGSVLAELSGRLQVNELIAKYLNGIEELIIVPHLMLHQIPFAALPVADPPQPPSVRGGQEASDACESLLPRRLPQASAPPQPPLLRGGQEASNACESLLPRRLPQASAPPQPPLLRGGQEASDACESLLPRRLPEASAPPSPP